MNITQTERRTAFILAAGLGTRLKEMTNAYTGRMK